MALYHFECTGCGDQSRRLLEPGKAKGQICSICINPLKRVPRPPSTHVVETLDNGSMVKKVERFSEAERLFRERAKNDPRNKP